ncbi:MAG: sulfurtransferase, partial [Endomicrobiales bacterium]
AFKGWGDGLEQAMVAYSLARFGHDSLYLLDGGIDKWKAEGRALTKYFPRVPPSDFTPEVRSGYFIGYDEFKQVKDSESVTLIDSRPAALYEGQGPWIKPGHIPGAINLPWTSLMDGRNRALLKTDEELQRILSAHEIGPDKNIIVYCGTGREATNEFLLFKWYLSYPSVRLYEGSFTEWCSYPENPTVTGKYPHLVEAAAVTYWMI